MKIKILGSGCMNCQTLEKRMAMALEELNLNATHSS
ncbi:MAG: thioredoxin family protein [Candidatus Kryptoniota bacterium]